MTDDDMVYLYSRTLLPLLSGYRPQLIMVAAGFDAHEDDPLGKSHFTEDIYGRITRMILDFYAIRKRFCRRCFLHLKGGMTPEILNCLGAIGIHRAHRKRYFRKSAGTGGRKHNGPRPGNDDHPSAIRVYMSMIKARIPAQYPDTANLSHYEKARASFPGKM
jgi:hypothetical protein